MLRKDKFKRIYNEAIVLGGLALITILTYILVLNLLFTLLTLKI